MWPKGPCEGRRQPPKGTAEMCTSQGQRGSGTLKPNQRDKRPHFKDEQQTFLQK